MVDGGVEREGCSVTGSEESERGVLALAGDGIGLFLIGSESCEEGCRGSAAFDGATVSGRSGFADARRPQESVGGEDIFLESVPLFLGSETDLGVVASHGVDEESDFFLEGELVRGDGVSHPVEIEEGGDDEFRGRRCR